MNIAVDDSEFAGVPASGTVLLVEDDPEVRFLAEAVIEDAGYRVVEADTADAAMAILERSAHDIATVFTDVQLPGSIDGVSLAQTVGKVWPWIRLVVTSGRRWDAAGELPKGALFLPKPWQPQDVLHAIGPRG